MNILFWCPHINKGGGYRLLLELVTSIKRNPEINKVRLAIPCRTIEDKHIDRLKAIGVEIFNLSSDHRARKTLYWQKNNNKTSDIIGFNKLMRFFQYLWNGFQKDYDKELLQAATDFDLIYVNWPQQQTFPEAGKPVICTWQDVTVLDFPEILGGKLTSIEFENTRSWLNKSSQVIVSSESTREKMTRYFGDRCKNIPIIHHAIKPDQGIIETPIAPQYQNTLPNRWIIYPSNTTAHKNHYVLLNAWSRFTGREEFPLLMIGSGTEFLNREPGGRYPETTQALRLLGLIHRKGLKPNKDFFALGYVDDSQVLPLIKNATALIMPSLTEGGGSFPVEEALDLGIPVLCSDIPVMREHLSRRSARIIWFDPESPDSILGALTELLEHYDQYKESAVLGMQDERPTWDDVASEYIKIFQETLRIQETSN